VNKFKENDKSDEERNPAEGTKECERRSLPDFIGSLSQAASKLPNVREMAKREWTSVPLGLFICEFPNRCSVKRLPENHNSIEGKALGEATMFTDFVVWLSQPARESTSLRDMAKRESSSRCLPFISDSESSRRVIKPWDDGHRGIRAVGSTLSDPRP
jgi:hypothetical protein